MASTKSQATMLAAGAAAGLAGGLAAGSRRGFKRRRGLFDRRPRLLGVPIGPKSGALRTVQLLRDRTAVGLTRARARPPS